MQFLDCRQSEIVAETTIGEKTQKEVVGAVVAVVAAAAVAAVAVAAVAVVN